LTEDPRLALADLAPEPWLAPPRATGSSRDPARPEPLMGSGPSTGRRSPRSP